MREVVTLFTVCWLSGQARADVRVDQLVKGYEREQTSCGVHEGGLAKMLDGASMLLEHGAQDGLAEDVERLHAAHEIVASYCTALAATIEFLHSDSSATYKSLEKQIGERDNHIRTLRASSKKVLDDTEPLIQRWIPKINAARIENDKAAVPKSASKQQAPEGSVPASQPKPEPRPQPKPEPRPEPKPEAPPLKPEPAPDTAPVSARFPSGRAVKLPQLGGKWEVRGDAATDVAEYVEGDVHTSVVAEVFSGVSCASQLARLQSKAYGRDGVKEQPREGQAWRVRIPGSDAGAIVVCGSTRAGSVIVTFDAADGSHPDLSALAVAMLAGLAK
jgi:hypothetical protein